MNYIKDFFKKFNLQAEDIIKKMNLYANSPPLKLNALKEKFQNVNPLLKETKVAQLCKEILKGREQIEAKELIEIINSLSSKIILLPTQKFTSKGSYSHGIEKNDWYLKQLLHIKRSIKNLLHLRENFEVNISAFFHLNY